MALYSHNNAFKGIGIMKIGIDLGTTNTVAGWMNIYGNIEFLEFDDGRTFLPSCVFFDRGKSLSEVKPLNVRRMIRLPLFRSQRYTWTTERKPGKRKAEDTRLRISPLRS